MNDDTPTEGELMDMYGEEYEGIIAKYDEDDDDQLEFNFGPPPNPRLEGLHSRVDELIKYCREQDITFTVSLENDFIDFVRNVGYITPSCIPHGTITILF